MTTANLKKPNRYDLADDVEGLLVMDVDEDSDAGEKGIRRGDVIDEIQQTPVLNADDAKAAIAKAKQDQRKSVLLRVLSGKKVGFVGVKLTG